MLEEEEYIVEEEVEVKQQQGDKKEKTKSTLSPDVEYALEDGFLNVFRDKNALFLNSRLVIIYLCLYLHQLIHICYC